MTRDDIYPIWAFKFDTHRHRERSVSDMTARFIAMNAQAQFASQMQKFEQESKARVAELNNLYEMMSDEAKDKALMYKLANGDL